MIPKFRRKGYEVGWDLTSPWLKLLFSTRSGNISGTTKCSKDRRRARQLPIFSAAVRNDPAISASVYN
jgi:hypothetical protein